MKKILILDWDGTITSEIFPHYYFIEDDGYAGGTAGKRFSDELAEAKKDKAHEATAFVSLIQKILAGRKLTPDEIREHQKTLKFNPGAEDFFDNTKTQQSECYIVTSGFMELLHNMPITENINKIYGSTFDGKIMSYKDKAEVIKEILKINGRQENDCQNVFYVGDGVTDAPAMRYVHENGGTAILVHPKGATGEVRDRIEKKGNIIDHYAEADYRIGSKLFNILTDRTKETEKLPPQGKDTADE